MQGKIEMLSNPIIDLLIEYYFFYFYYFFFFYFLFAEKMRFGKNQLVHG